MTAYLLAAALSFSLPYESASVYLLDGSSITLAARPARFGPEHRVGRLWGSWQCGPAAGGRWVEWSTVAINQFIEEVPCSAHF